MHWQNLWFVRTSFGPTRLSEALLGKPGTQGSYSPYSNESTEVRMRSHKVKRSRLLTALAAALTITGCGSTSIPVLQSPQSPPPPSSATVVITPATATVFRGKTQLFKATVSGQADQTVIWSLDANIGSIDSTGLYTAPSDSAPNGGVYINATSKTVPSASGTVL